MAASPNADCAQLNSAAARRARPRDPRQRRRRDTSALYNMFSDSSVETVPHVRNWSEEDVLISDEGRVRVRAVARSPILCSDIYEADPGGSSGGSCAHDGEECVLVPDGTAEFFFGDLRKLILREGESISFNSRIPHRWVNAGSGQLQMIWTNARPPRQPPASKPAKGAAVPAVADTKRPTRTNGQGTKRHRSGEVGAA